MVEKTEFERGIIIGGLAREMYEEQLAEEGNRIGARWHVLREDIREGYVTRAAAWLGEFEARNRLPGIMFHD